MLDRLAVDDVRFGSATPGVPTTPGAPPVLEDEEVELRVLKVLESDEPVVGVSLLGATEVAVLGVVEMVGVDAVVVAIFDCRSV